MNNLIWIAVLSLVLLFALTMTAIAAPSVIPTPTATPYVRPGLSSPTPPPSPVIPPTATPTATEERPAPPPDVPPTGAPTIEVTPPTEPTQRYVPSIATPGA